MVYSGEINNLTVMDSIKDFRDALTEFKKISAEMIPDRKMYGSRSFGNIKRFNNLDEFKQYHLTYYTYKGGTQRSSYVKKTDKVYKKRGGITSKITIDRKENPREWNTQYKWFCSHPEADVYAPQAAKSHRGNLNRNGGRKPSEISKKITVKRSEDVKEYNRQYAWFKKYPESEHCPPRKLKN